MDRPVAKKKPAGSVTAEQKRKARRLSHSDIERRRRIKINEQFNALRQLVPACARLAATKKGGDNGLHKLDILQETVAFIRQLVEQPPQSTPPSPPNGPSNPEKLRISHLLTS